MKDILKLLGVNVIVTGSAPEPEPSCFVVALHEPKLTHYDFQKLCSVLCAYRFYEIISLRAQCISRIPISYPTACMFLPGPPSSKNLDVSALFVPYLISNDPLGIFPFGRLAQASQNLSEGDA